MNNTIITIILDMTSRLNDWTVRYLTEHNPSLLQDMSKPVSSSGTHLSDWVVKYLAEHNPSLLQDMSKPVSSSGTHLSDWVVKYLAEHRSPVTVLPWWSYKL